MEICLLGYDNLPVLAREYNQFEIGGAQVQMTLLAKALVKRGHRVSMVVGDYGQEDGVVWQGIKTYRTYKANEGLPLFRFVYPRWTSTWAALYRANADVYVTSCAGMQVGLLALFCNKHSKNFIYRMASDTDAEPTEVIIKHWRDKKLYEYGLNKAAHIVCQNKKQRELLKLNYDRNATLIKSLVEEPLNDYVQSERDIEILWVANIRNIKRPDLAIELARRLPHRHFNMVGGPLSGCRELYLNIEKEAGSIENINFHGRIPYHDVGDLYDKARVFVNTSDKEGFPNTFLQSWRRGIPVVTFFDPDGIITREGLGYAVNSMDEMEKVVEKLINNDDEWLLISNRCRAYVELHHGDDVVMKPFLNVLQQVENIGSTNE
ncbi:MAG: glycosyltransferase family 4 protein [Candidatus Thiodiazotropha endolucinida]|nr:glycosyltransferase family 4 protein [Candidatus Thiodiazotropha taylori]MCW4301144.1 glycosyltransferase family 4 protein [Candidatus Thiodiazotropha endolucinida]MCG8105523.1 glycosyltransferase family 4 protein [Candidatus Thiodiazotropha taylori]MCG8116849.1 glycosyltransferase family 4 protein [Candidatus Thiodiazotropha taylori]MCW4277859.1 glycosyltransferase family 4 protein [Candidatus Thiodiazotropha taylori]